MNNPFMNDIEKPSSPLTFLKKDCKPKEVVCEEAMEEVKNINF